MLGKVLGCAETCAVTGDAHPNDDLPRRFVCREDEWRRNQRIAKTQTSYSVRVCKH
jgi:hypothetical protein